MAQNDAMKTRQVLLLILLFAGGLAAQDTTHFINRFKFSNEKEWTEKRMAYYLNKEEIYSADLEGFYRRGIRNLQLEFYDSAIVDFKRSIDMASYETMIWQLNGNVRDYYPLYLIGVCFNGLNQPDSAEVYYRRSIETDATFEDPYLELAKLNAQWEQFEKAIDYCDQVLEMNEKSGDAHYLKALIYNANEEEKKTLKELKKANKVDPSHAFAPLLLAEIYLNKKRNTEVIKYCSQSIKLDSTIAMAYLYRGMGYLNKGQYHTAFDDFSKGAQLDSVEGIFKYYLGTTSIKMKDYTEGIAYLTTNIKKEQENEGVYYTDSWDDLELQSLILQMNEQKLSEDETKVGHVFLDLIFSGGTYDDVQMIYKRVTDNPESVFIERVFNYVLFIQYGYGLNEKRSNVLIDHDSTLSFVMVLNAHLKQIGEKNQESIEMLSSAISATPNYTYAYNLRGMVYAATKQFDKALQDFQYAVKLNPDYLIAQYNAADTYYNLAFYRQALNSFKAFQKKLKEFPLLDCSIGKCFFELMEYDSAMNYYDKALALSPGFPEAYHGKGKVFFQTEDYQNAMINYNKCIHFGGKEGVFFLDRAKLKMTRKEYTSALMDFEEAINADGHLAEAYYGAGWASYLIGKYFQCIDYSTLAVQNNQKDFKAMFNIAIAHLRLGHFDESRKYFLSAAKANLVYSDTIESKVFVDLQNLIDADKFKEAAQEIMEMLLELNPTEVKEAS